MEINKELYSDSAGYASNVIVQIYYAAASHRARGDIARIPQSVEPAAATFKSAHIHYLGLVSEHSLHTKYYCKHFKEKSRTWNYQTEHGTYIHTHAHAHTYTHKHCECLVNPKKREGRNTFL